MNVTLPWYVWAAIAVIWVILACVIAVMAAGSTRHNRSREYCPAFWVNLAQGAPHTHTCYHDARNLHRVHVCGCGSSMEYTR